ncbi:MAG: thermosome subunit alpha [Candidatus Hodarchaeales archaeon]|jgi:thermosome
MTLQGTPVFILKDDTSRTTGKDATQSNIAAARLISEAIRSALGPKGMDKMLLDNFGDVVITNDGATILKEIDIAHPIGKMMVELSKIQDQEVGDGTTSVVILAGELLSQAAELISRDKIHPTILVEGYRVATEKALEFLDEIASDVAPDNDDLLKEIVITSMGSKIVARSSDILAKVVIEAVKSIDTGSGKIDIDDIKVEKKEGEDIESTLLVKGIVLDKEVVHAGMPKKLENPKIALITEAFEVSKTEFDSELSITDPTKIQEFLDREAGMIQKMVDKVVEAGANVVIAQKGIDDVAQHLLAKQNIMAIRRVKKSDVEKLSKATGAAIVNNLPDLSAEDLGTAGKVYETKIGDDDMIFIEDCPDAKSVTILVRGGTELVVDEAERSIHDAICVVRNVLEDKKIVAGGGAPEAYVSRKLHKFAETLIGREQLAVQAFANALEVIPRTLAENAGLDPIDIVVALRNEHESGNFKAGVDVFGGKVKNMEGVIEPLRVKTHAISAASENAQMILRIDDIIAAKASDGPPAGGPGGPGGMGGDDFD